jgi:hypothetical protein
MSFGKPHSITQTGKRWFGFNASEHRPIGNERIPTPDEW